MTPNPNHRWLKMSENQNPDAVELPYKTAKNSPRHLQIQSGHPATMALGSYSLATGSLGMDKSTLKVHLPDGSFNVVRFGDATDIKVSMIAKKTNILGRKKRLTEILGFLHASSSNEMSFSHAVHASERKPISTTLTFFVTLF